MTSFNQAISVSVQHLGYPDLVPNQEQLYLFNDHVVYMQAVKFMLFLSAIIDRTNLDLKKLIYPMPTVYMQQAFSCNSTCSLKERMNNHRASIRKHQVRYFTQPK